MGSRFVINFWNNLIFRSCYLQFLYRIWWNKLHLTKAYASLIHLLYKVQFYPALQLTPPKIKVVVYVEICLLPKLLILFPSNQLYVIILLIHWWIMKWSYYLVGCVKWWITGSVFIIFMICTEIYSEHSLLYVKLTLGQKCVFCLLWGGWDFQKHLIFI